MLEKATQQAQDWSDAYEIEEQRNRVERQLSAQRKKRLNAIRETQEFIKEQMVRALVMELNGMEWSGVHSYC